MQRWNTSIVTVLGRFVRVFAFSAMLITLASVQASLSNWSCVVVDSTSVRTSIQQGSSFGRLKINLDFSGDNQSRCTTDSVAGIDDTRSRSMTSLAIVTGATGGDFGPTRVSVQFFAAGSNSSYVEKGTVDVPFNRPSLNPVQTDYSRPMIARFSADGQHNVNTEVDIVFESWPRTQGGDKGAGSVLSNKAASTISM